MVFCFLILLSACNNDPDKNEPVIPTSEKLNEENRLKEAILQYPDSLLMKENLIQYFRESGDYSNALKEVSTAIDKDSGNSRLWEIKATLQTEDADTMNAIRSFEKAISIFPAPQYLISLGTLYAQTKDPRALKLANLLLATNHNKTEKEAYYIKGLFHAFNNEKNKAIEYFDKCLLLNYTFMFAYREKAIALYDQQKYSEALAVLDKAITLQNNFDEGYYYSGKCLEKLNRIPEAIQSYQNALVYDPEYMEAKEALAKLVKSGK